jgi:hypothetical protein
MNKAVMKKTVMKKTVATSGAAIIVLACIAPAAWWYWSPLLVLRAMQSSAQARDATAFNRHIDYPAVRLDLKRQLAARIGQTLEAPAGAGGAQFGGAMGNLLIDKLIEALVQPATVMHAMQTGCFTTPPADGDDTPANRAPAPSPGWSITRTGSDKMIAQAAQDGHMAVVLERRGFADWQVTALTLPH